MFSKNGKEGETIYTRNYGKPARSGGAYRPPPGYDGNAFSGWMEGKMHEAEDDVSKLPRRPRELPEEVPDGRGGTDESKPAPAEVKTRPSAEPESEPTTEPVTENRSGETAMHSLPVFAPRIQALEDLFRHLRGKFGREELILVLVMLLVASEGASLELMLLALLLIAG